MGISVAGIFFIDNFGSTMVFFVLPNDPAVRCVVQSSDGPVQCQSCSVAS